MALLQHERLWERARPAAPAQCVPGACTCAKRPRPLRRALWHSALQGCESRARAVRRRASEERRRGRGQQRQRRHRSAHPSCRHCGRGPKACAQRGSRSEAAGAARRALGGGALPSVCDRGPDVSVRVVPARVLLRCGGDWRGGTGGRACYPGQSDASMLRGRRRCSAKTNGEKQVFCKKRTVFCRFSPFVTERARQSRA